MRTSFRDEEVVVKPLGKIVGEVQGISGATITGDGKVVLGMRGCYG